MTPDFESLLADHGPALFAYLWRLLRDEPDAEDCLQETFLRAYQAYDRLGDHPNPAAWLYRIATNTARTHQRRRARTHSRTAPLDPARAAAGGRHGVAEVVGRRQALAAVAAAVEALPHQQRAALILRKYQGLSYAEIGAAIDCTAAAARANVYQALKRLRVELAGVYEEV